MNTFYSIYFFLFFYSLKKVLKDRRVTPVWRGYSILTEQRSGGSAGVRNLTVSEDAVVIWKPIGSKTSRSTFAQRHRSGRIKMKVKRAVGGQEQVNGRGKGLFLSHWMNWLLLQRSIKSHYHLKTSNPAKRLEPFNHCLSARSIRSRLVIESRMGWFSVLQGACCL